LGQDMRRRRGKQRADEVRASLRESGIDPDSEAGRRLEALVSLLISSSAFLQLHQTQGEAPDQAIAYASWAIFELLAAAAREESRRGRRPPPTPANCQLRASEAAWSCPSAT